MKSSPSMQPQKQTTNRAAIASLMLSIVSLLNYLVYLALRTSTQGFILVTAITAAGSFVSLIFAGIAFVRRNRHHRRWLAIVSLVLALATTFVMAILVLNIVVYAWRSA